MSVSVWTAQQNCWFNAQCRSFPYFSWITFHNKYINAGQKCNSARANCLLQQANEQCTLDAEGIWERAGRNCTDGLWQCRVSVQPLRIISVLPRKVKKFKIKIMSRLAPFPLISQSSFSLAPTWSRNINATRVIF